MYTRNQITDGLNRSNQWVERGILALYERQTLDERASCAVRHNNDLGFMVMFAAKGTYYANWIRSGRTLTGKHLDLARKICIKQVGQLTDIANGVR
jgi:hypothetical protein